MIEITKETDLSTIKVTERVRLHCDECNEVLERTIKLVKRGRFRSGGFDLCRTCACRCAAKKKPQNQKDFWNEEKRKKHSEAIKASQIYYDGIASRDTTGPKNSMFGKKHSPEAIRKMSVSRMGKFGESATAWKGGTQSLTKQVKRAIQARYNWFGRILERDLRVCQQCGMKAKDAHHIEPVVTIIKRLLSHCPFDARPEIIEWLLVQPELKDDSLENGISLCRPCHISVHQNWGSHESP